MVVDATKFNTAIANAKKALSADKYRPLWGCIHLFSKNYKLYVEACDGFRMHRAVLDIFMDAKEEDINVLVKDIDKIPKGVEVITIKVDGDKLQVYDKTYDCEQDFDGYLDVDGLIPKYEDTMVIRFNVKYLMDALQHIKGEDKWVDISFDKDGKTDGIKDISPMLLKSGNQINMVLPIRRDWR